MSQYDLNYLYENDFNKEFQKALQEPKKDIRTLSSTCVENAVILPGKPDPSRKLPWGKGGVLDDKREFVEKSGIIYAFGGKFETKK